jgi:hypothetical protein
MKKVVYNNCYGGFGLSPIATYEIAKRKGIEVFIYHYKFDGNELYRKIDLVEGWFDVIPNRSVVIFLTADLGNEITKYPNSLRFDGVSLKRTDEDLVSVVESLGEKANGKYADLQIAVVENKYRIIEYDGAESVETPDDIEWDE